MVVDGVNYRESSFNGPTILNTSPLTQKDLLKCSGQSKAKFMYFITVINNVRNKIYICFRFPSIFSVFYQKIENPGEADNLLPERKSFDLL